MNGREHARLFPIWRSKYCNGCVRRNELRRRLRRTGYLQYTLEVDTSSSGGLSSYAANELENYRRAATYVEQDTERREAR